MSRFTELSERIEELTTASARFRRVVLHAHSPDSYDFGQKECDSYLNEKNQYLTKNGEEGFIRHFAENIDLIAITDHMKFGYACRLSSWVKKQNLSPCVLPGIELSVRLAPPLNQMKFHMLLIFPENSRFENLEKIFPGNFPIDDERDGHEEITIEDLPDFLRKIREEHKGLCIAAHVDNNNGVRYLFRQTGKETIALFDPEGNLSQDDERNISNSFKEFLESMRFDGIEIAKPADRTHYSWETITQPDAKHHVPVFLTFDAHTIEEIKALENTKKDRITYVKMSEISWDGLYKAIQFPSTRIRFAEDRTPPPYISGIEIISTDENGFFENLIVGFTQNLNCVIGPRGAGKSTLIDAIRYVFGYNRSLDELESEDLSNQVKNRQEATLNGTIIRIAYCVNENKTHFLEATYNAKSQYVTKVYGISGEEIAVQDVERSGSYPLRLFGWSEIETLGRDPNRQLDLLDKLVEGLQVHLDKRKEIRARLSQSSQELMSILHELKMIFDKDGNEIEKYQEYKHDFDTYNTHEIEELFTTFDQLDAQKRVLQDLSKTLGARIEHISKVSPICLEEEVAQSFKSNPELETWWNANKEPLLSFSSIESEVDQKINDILGKLTSLKERVDCEILSVNDHSSEIESQIKNNLNADPQNQRLADLRMQSKTQLESVENLRSEYFSYYENFKQKFSERFLIIEELIACQNEISQLRMNKQEDIASQLNEFQTEDMKVEIKLIKEGDRQLLLNFIQTSKFLGKVATRWNSYKWPELLSTICTPIELANTLINKTPNTLITTSIIDGNEKSITSENAESIIESLNPFKTSHAASVDIIDEECMKDILDLQELPWDDKISILRNNHPIENGSPGQRSSAMLPLIALSEDVPLVIDQPEDNLDNRLVGTVLVDILAKLKEKRQIIVCTHNPNIVVLGDAEHVISLEADSNEHGHVEEPQASIDHPEIINRIIDIMEGGKEAFETRKKRYSN